MLSVVLATRNEEKNIANCLDSIKEIADEILIVDEKSTDRTVEIAKTFGANVYEVDHQPIFHINKQKAIDLAKGNWILQLDADEIVTPELSKEIKELTSADKNELLKGRLIDNAKSRLFLRHQKLIEEREGGLGKKTGEIVAFFVPRRNIFLGKPLIHAGVYPDGVIRLIKKGKARFPAKSVHELMEIDGEVSWLTHDLLHNDSPTFKRYLDRANRYTDLTAKEFEKKKVATNLLALLYFSFLYPLFYFLKLFIRHKGFLDGFRGFVWSFFSALHFPIAYFKYWQMKKK